MDKRCETCRFWDQNYAEQVDDETWNVCNRAYTSEYKVQGRMVVTAADPYDLALITAPDFGCTEWQGQEASHPKY